MPRRTPIVSTKPEEPLGRLVFETPPESPKDVYDRTAGAGPNRVIELPAVPDGAPLYVDSVCPVCGTAKTDDVCVVDGHRLGDA